MGVRDAKEIGVRAKDKWSAGPEVISIAVVLAATLLVHLWMPVRHPTPLYSDFLSIVTFASDIAKSGPFAPGWYWTLFSAGTPTLLSIPLALSGAEDATVARLATGFVIASLPMVPMFMLRGVCPLWTRCAVAVILVFLPANIAFSGVVAQDNWVQLPALALACLAVRNAYGQGSGYPVSSAVLWCLSLYIRQEMLLALLPLALLAAWPLRGSPRARPIATFTAVALVLMLGIAGQRQAASGKFSLTSQHGGASMLGSYIPGAGFGWIPYDDYVARRAPELLGNADALRSRAGSLALDEIRERPWFHLVRRAGAVVDTATGHDGSLQYWAFGAGGAKGPERSTDETAAVARLGAFFTRPIVLSAVLLHALFLAAVYIGLKTRDRALIAIALAVLLKIGIHFVFAVQARFFLVVLVLEVLAIGTAALRVYRLRSLLKGAAVVAAIGLMSLAVAVTGLGRLGHWVAEQDQIRQQALLREYRARAGLVLADCHLAGGRVLASGPSGFAFAVEHADPEPGEFAELRCRLSPIGKGGGVALEVEDGYAPGGLQDRMFQIVEVEGAVVRRHDIAAEAWSGWWRRNVSVAAGSSLEVRVRVEALRPDKGPAWGDAARTTVRFAEIK